MIPSNPFTRQRRRRRRDKKSRRPGTPPWPPRLELLLPATVVFERAVRDRGPVLDGAVLDRRVATRGLDGLGLAPEAARALVDDAFLAGRHRRATAAAADTRHHRQQDQRGAAQAHDQRGPV